MEKYTKWRDAGTGIAPFLPVDLPEQSMAMLPLRLVLVLLKTILLVVALLLLLLVETLLQFALASVSRTAYHYVLAYTARLALLFLGFIKLPMTYDGRVRARPRKGDVVIVNRSSPVDILILAWLYPGAIFTRTGPEMLFQSQSLFGAMISSFRLQHTRKGYQLTDYVRGHSDRVIIIFPEATTSNNRGILAFCPIMVERAYVLSIKYNNPPYLATPIPGRFWHFMWALLSLPIHVCRLKGSSKAIDKDHAGTLSRLGRVPLTQLGIEDKDAFLQAWHGR